MVVTTLVLVARCEGRRNGRVVAGVDEVIDGVLNSDHSVHLSGRLKSYRGIENN